MNFCEPASRAHGRPREAAVSTTFSVPFNLSTEVSNSEVAQLTEDDSEQGTRRRPQGHEIFHVLRHEKIPLGAREELARRCALTNLPFLLMMRDRLIIDGSVISVTPWNLIHLEPLPARKCDRLRQDGVRETGGHWVPRSFPSCKGLRGAACRCWVPPDLRNTRLTRFDGKKEDNESFHVRGGEYVTPRMFTLPVKVSACFRSSFSVQNTFMPMNP